MTDAEKIRKIADDKGITLHKLADMAGVSYHTIYSATKRNTQYMRPKIMAKIVKIAGDTEDKKDHTEISDELAEAILDAVANASTAYQAMLRGGCEIFEYERTGCKEHLEKAKNLLEPMPDFRHSIVVLNKFLQGRI